MVESISKSRGRIAELTHLVPIRRGRVPERDWGGDCLELFGAPKQDRTPYAVRLGTILRAFDDREEKGFPSVIRLFRQIHFSKWAILDGGTRLLLSVVFDGDWGDYMRALAREVPAMLHLIWCNTSGWEDDFIEGDAERRSEQLMRYISRYQVEVSFLYAHHPNLTVRDIDLLLHPPPLDARERTRAMGSLEERRAIYLEDFERRQEHAVAKAKARFTALLAPRYAPNVFERAYLETFGTKFEKREASR